MNDTAKSSTTSNDNEQNQVLDKDSYSLEVTRPVWMPYNDVAKLLVNSLVEQFAYPASGPKAERYAVVVASLLKAAQTLITPRSTDLPHYIGIRRRASGWSRYPMVGKDISKTVVDDFLEAFGGQLVKGSGTSGLHKDHQGLWRTDPRVSMYSLDLAKLPAQLLAAKFIEVGRPFVKVNPSETRHQKSKRKAQRLSKEPLNRKTAIGINKEAHTASENRIQRLNDYWLRHPLELPNGHAAACATRVFHDGRLDAGGRLYGAWTGLDQKDSRLNCTIDSEAVVEIDIRASQPTLLSSLLGFKLGGLGPQGGWDDVYGELSKLASTDHWRTLADDTLDVIDHIKRNRSAAKGVVMALIGSGLPLKAKATTELVTELGLTPEGWSFFRNRLVATVPALNELEARYDEKGNLDGYINGPGFLSYHESEMMLSTLEALVDLDIPAYSVHDCLIVKVSDATVAAKIFRETIYRYCKQLSGIEVLVPLSITVGCGTPRDLLPSDDDLKGKYLN